MIFNTVIQGSVAGINGDIAEYMATENIQRGDFVQLATVGMSEPTLSAVASADLMHKYAFSTIKILSSTLMLAVWAQQIGPDGISSNDDFCIWQLYMQAYHLKNNAWVAGARTSLYVHSITNTTIPPRVAIEKLTANRAVIVAGIYGTSTELYSKVFVVDVDNTGTITVAAELPIYSIGLSSYYRINVIAITSSKFVVCVPYSIGSSSNITHKFYYYYCSYIDGSVTVLTEGAFSGSRCYTCKLNDTQILVVGDSNYKIMTVQEDTVAVADTITEWNSVWNGPITQVGENKVVLTRTNAESSTTRQYYPKLLTYDPETNSIAEEFITSTNSPYYTYDVVKINDDQVCSLAWTSSTHSISTAYFGMIDLINKTVHYKPVGIGLGDDPESVKRVDVAHGWLAVVGTDSTLQTMTVHITPIVSQVTVAPYSTRIDGVAIKGANVGQMAEIVTPADIHVTPDEITDSQPVVS